ncbi:MAG: hypothetical protein ABJC87_22280 [Roseobacter sp.]
MIFDFRYPNGFFARVAYVFNIVAQVVMISMSTQIANSFVDETAVSAEVARMLIVMACLLFLLGPLVTIETNVSLKSKLKRRV